MRMTNDPNQDKRQKDKACPTKPGQRRDKSATTNDWWPMTIDQQPQGVRMDDQWLIRFKVWGSKFKVQSYLII